MSARVGAREESRAKEKTVAPAEKSRTGKKISRAKGKKVFAKRKKKDTSTI